jgi:hypothetical protein
MSVLLKVSSRHVFFVTGMIYVIFGIIGKISAVFICIPYPVLGKTTYEPRHDKTNIVGLRPAWMQTSLRIRAV